MRKHKIFCQLLEDLCCLLQVRTSMIMIYRALQASDIDQIDYTGLQQQHGQYPRDH